MFNLYRKVVNFALAIALIMQDKAVAKARQMIAANEERIGFLEAQHIDLENKNDELVDWLEKNHVVL